MKIETNRLKWVLHLLHSNKWIIWVFRFIPLKVPMVDIFHNFYMLCLLNQALLKSHNFGAPPASFMCFPDTHKMGKIHLASRKNLTLLLFMKTFSSTITLCQEWRLHSRSVHRISMNDRFIQTSTRIYYYIISG